jgi:hypothetical protein
MKWNKWLMAGMAAAAVLLNAGKAEAQTPGWSAVPIASGLQACYSNLTYTVSNTNAAGGLPSGAAAGRNFTLVGWVSAPTNTTFSAAQALATANTATMYFDYLYPDGSRTTTDPLSIAVTVTGSNTTVVPFVIQATNATGAVGIIADKTTTSQTNYVYWAITNEWQN